MGKTLVYLVLLVVLGFGVYYFIFKENDALYNDKEAAFTFRDTAAIGRIFLVNTQGESILLDRKSPSLWQLNQHYIAMPIQIKNILTCLKLQSPLKPVADVDYDRVIKLLAGLGVKVELYNLKHEKIAAFTVAGQGPNYHGSYMLMEGASTPYLVEIPGFDGYLSPRFTVELNDWRSRAMIQWPTDSIAQIAVQYAAPHQQDTYTFTLQNGALQCTTDAAFAKNNTKELNQRRAWEYLGFFKDINAEGFLNGSIGLDTAVANAKLRCNLFLKSKSGEEKNYNLYWIPTKNSSNVEIDGAPKDIERLYAIDLVNKDTLLVQARTFDKLLRKAHEFYEH